MPSFPFGYVSHIFNRLHHCFSYHRSSFSFSFVLSSGLSWFTSHFISLVSYVWMIFPKPFQPTLCKCSLPRFYSQYSILEFVPILIPILRDFIRNLLKQLSIKRQISFIKQRNYRLVNIFQLKSFFALLLKLNRKFFL